MCRVPSKFRGIQLVHGCWVTDFEFADDIVLLEEEPATLQPLLYRFKGKRIKHEVLHDITRFITLYPHQWRHFGTGTLFQVPRLYNPTEPPSQRRG